MLERLKQYALLMRLHRPIGILLLLWPTLWALWIAGDGHPNGYVVIVFLLGVVLMRSAGCVINDYADRDFDPHVARTRTRPIAAGKVSPREALILFVLLCLVAFALVLTLDTFTIFLSIGGLLLAAIYPFTKRYTHLPQVVLGAAFGWAIPMAFAAQTGALPKMAWLIYGVALVWTVAYDTLYAMVDRDDDLKVGVKSTAILFGKSDRWVIAVMQVIVLLGLYLIGVQAQRGVAFNVGIAVAAVFAVYQQWLIRQRQPAACLRAFLNNNWFGAAVFVGLLVDYLF